MRADRLISIIMLLQARGRMTAQALAEELEVSARTIYRDVDALGASGVPIYADRGVGGGYALLPGYRTTLTGLTRDEVRALCMLGVPAPLDQLGVTDDLRAALRKLAAALPDAHRVDETAVRRRIHLDATWWFQGDERSPHLRTVQRAVWEDRCLHVTYEHLPGPRVEIAQDVAPYGLVAKAGVWYLVYERAGAVRARRVSDFRTVRLLDRSFERPEDFDLPAFWTRWSADYEQRPRYAVEVRVAPHFVSWLPVLLGRFLPEDFEAARAAGEEDAPLTLTLAFESLEEARGHLLSCGGGVEVLAPRALRCSLIDYAEQILRRYAEKNKTAK